LVVVDAHELSSLCNCTSVTEGSSPEKMVTFNFAPRNSTQAASAMKKTGQGGMDWFCFGQESNSSRRVIFKIEIRIKQPKLNLVTSAVTPVLPPREDCLICPSVPLRGNIFATRPEIAFPIESIECRLLVRRFSLMRFHFDKQRCCSAVVLFRSSSIASNKRSASGALIALCCFSIFANFHSPCFKKINPLVHGACLFQPICLFSF